jgi:hypothetical protein
MAEPASTAGATLAAAVVTVPSLTAFGVPLGLRADLLMAGFAGGLVALILFNTVPSDGDTWRALVRTTIRRMLVAFASSLTAGYATPVVMVLVTLPDPVIIGAAFGVGGGAQKVLSFLIDRFSGASTRGPTP